MGDRFAKRAEATPEPAARLTRLAPGALCAAAFACAAATVSAHVIYTPTTLRQWVQEAELIVVAEIVAPLSVWRAPDGSDAQEFISVRVTAVLKGAAPSVAAFDFFPHSEGEPRYRVGDRALLFLEGTASRAEFAALAGRFPYFSRQGAGSEWRLAAADDPALDMARAWVATRGAATLEQQRSLLLRELLLDDARLRRDALLELVRYRRQPGAWPDAEAVAPFARLAADPARDVPSRVALLRVLDGAPGFDSAALLLPLTRQALDDRARQAVVSAAALSRDARLSAWLAQQLADPDPRVRRQAASALAHPWHAAHVAALAELAKRDPDAGAARAAVGALAAIDTDTARAALTTVADERSDSVANTARRLLESGRPSAGATPLP